MTPPDAPAESVASSPNAPDADDTDRALLNSYLATRDEPCPLCGYNLRALRGDHCPECGKALRLRVGLTEPNMGAFLFGLIAIAAGLGFSTLVLIWGTIVFLSGQGGPQPGDLALLLLETVLSGALLLAWVKLGRHFRQCDPATRRLLAGLCLFIPIVNVVLVIMFIA